MKKIILFLLLLTIGLYKIQSQIEDSGKIYLQKSYSFQKQSKYDSALFYGRKALLFFKNFPNDSLKIKSMLQVISTTDNLDENNKLSKKIRLIVKNNNDTDLLEKLYYAKANNYFNSKNFDLAVKYFLKIDSLSKEINKIDEILVKSIYKRAQISKLTFTHNGVELAHKLSLEALKKAKEIQNKYLENKIKLLISEILFLKDQPEKALKRLKETETYFVKNKDYNALSRMFLLKALHYKNDKKDYNKTDSIFSTSIKLLNGTEYNKELADMYIFYGDFLKDIKKNYQKALHQYILADSIFYNKNPILNLHYIYLLEGLSDAYEKLGDYKKGLYFNKLAYKNRKKLYKKQNRELSRRLEAKYQNQKKQNQISLLNKQKQNQRNLFISGLLIVGLTNLFLLFIYRNHKKAAKKLKELDTVKSQFFTNISHEFRTPLTLILGITQILLKNKTIADEDKKKLKTIKKNSNRLLELVNQLLDISKLKTGTVKLQKSHFLPKQIFNILLDSFLYQAKEKNINIHKNLKCDKQVYIDKEIFKKIITNLLSNAIKYTPEGGEINCSLVCQDNKLTFEIKNTGEGLSKQEIKHIFSRFYQKDNTSPGVGIGLSLIKNLVALHQGKISVKSKLQDWTIFKVEIPIDKIYKKQENFINSKKDFNKKTEIKEKKDKPTILIIEDNQEIANLIASALKDEFITITKFNGKEGLEQATKTLPDLIISDIMMPGINGLELCKILKKDTKTAHIPIIILTAKAGDENKIIGIKSGADDYITKPFNIEILKVKIKNLIKLRQNIRYFYKKYDALNIKNKNIKGINEIFLNRIEEVLKDKLTQTDFNTENFARAVGMSRMQLHRRIKEITGLTTSQFIRIQRIKLAAFLLLQSDTDVAQISYTVGFNSPSYFNKCFKEVYKCTPKEYANRNK